VPQGGDRVQLWLSRGSVVVMAVLATSLAFHSGNIYDLVAESSILGAVSILVPLLFALFVPRASATGALAAMACGLLAYLWFSQVWVDFPVPPLFVGMIASLSGMLLGMAGSTAPASAPRLP
jgi:Na+/proline symporter